RLDRGRGQEQGDHPRQQGQATRSEQRRRGFRAGTGGVRGVGGEVASGGRWVSRVLNWGRVVRSVGAEPVGAVYRVRLGREEVASAAVQARRGLAGLQGKGESALGEAWRRLAALGVRESAF
ncbi:hypothetical protein B1218_31075, partial [Pseudomonas ogarae]